MYAVFTTYVLGEGGLNVYSEIVKITFYYKMLQNNQ